MRRPVCGSKTRCCSAVGSRAYSGSTSVLRRSRSASAVSRISRSPERKTRTSPGGSRLELVDRVDDRLGLVARLGAVRDVVVGVVGVVAVVGRQVGFERAVADLDRVRAAGHLDDRRVAEVGGEALRLDGGRGDDHLQVGPARQQLAQVAEQEVDVEAALVRLVEDQRVVAQQPAVALDLGQQDAVGHQLHQRAVAGLVGEADGVADRVAERRVQLVGDALRDGARGQAARLGVPDRAADAAAELEADLGQLRGLARAGLAGDDDHLVGRDGGGDVVALGADRQVGIGDRRDGGGAGGDEGLGPGHWPASLASASGRSPRPPRCSCRPRRAASRIVSASRRDRSSATVGVTGPGTVSTIGGAQRSAAYRSRRSASSRALLSATRWPPAISSDAEAEPLAGDAALEVGREEPVVAADEHPDRDVGPALELARLAERRVGRLAGRVQLRLPGQHVGRDVVQEVRVDVEVGRRSHRRRRRPAGPRPSRPRPTRRPASRPAAGPSR